MMKWAKNHKVFHIFFLLLLSVMFLVQGPTIEARADCTAVAKFRTNEGSYSDHNHPAWWGGGRVRIKSCPYYHGRSTYAHIHSMWYKDISKTGTYKYTNVDFAEELVISFTSVDVGNIHVEEGGASGWEDLEVGDYVVTLINPQNTDAKYVQIDKYRETGWRYITTCYKDEAHTQTGSGRYSNGMLNGGAYFTYTHDTTSTVTKQPTCTATGIRTYKCTCGGANKTETIPALGHSTPSSWSYDGSNHYKNCTRCGARLQTVAHSLSGWQHDASNHWKKCSVCSATVQKAAHTKPSSWSHDATNHYKNCTVCGRRLETVAHTKPSSWSTNASSHYKNCTVCGRQLESAAHTKQSSWSQDATNHYKNCTVCGYRMETAAHSWSWKQDASGHWQACGTCGRTQNKAAHADPNGDGACDTCGRDIQAPELVRSTIQTDATGYYVYAFVTDNKSGVSKVAFPSWTEAGGQDDIQTDWQNKALGTAGSWDVNGENYNCRYFVAKADHKNEDGPYQTDIYVYDKDGNSAKAKSLTGITLLAKFIAQPTHKDVGHVSDIPVSINYGSGIIATMNKSVPVVLQYYNEETKQWTDTDIAITVSQGDSSYNVSSAEIPADSVILNHKVRLVAKDAVDVYSEEFYIAANQYTGSLPVPNDGMDETQVYGYAAGDELILTPDFKEPPAEEITQIIWQVSDDKGKTYQNIPYHIEETHPLIFKTEASCDMTGLYFRYTTDSVTYSDPFEVIVFEDYEIKDGTLHINGVGTGNNKTNDYGPGQRLNGYRPWESELPSINAIKLNDTIKVLGSHLFANMDKLESVDFGGIEEVGVETFLNCTSLRAARFPYETKVIRTDAFKGCAGLLEVVFENPGTMIDPNSGTIPMTYQDDTAPVATAKNQEAVAGMHNYPVIYGYKGIPIDTQHGLNGTTAGSTAYQYAKANNLGFLPIGAVDAYGYERPITWEYKLTGDKITQLSVSDKSRDNLLNESGVDFYIPKTIDGYKVTVLSENNLLDGELVCGKEEHFHEDSCIQYICSLPEDEDHTHEDSCISYICGKEEHYHDDPCYTERKLLTCTDADPNHIHDDSCYTYLTTHDIFGNFMEEERSVVIRNLYIPDTITEVRSGTFASMVSVQNVYDFSKTQQSWEESLSASEREDGQVSVLYSYSTNSGVRAAVNGFDHVILDVDELTGITGDLIWTVNLSNKTLSFTGTGKTDDYQDKASLPYGWISDEIEEVVIEPGVTGLGGYTCAGLHYLRKITNNSTDLVEVADTAFNDSGDKWTLPNKQLDTYVNNAIYDAVMDLNAGYNTDNEYVEALEEATQKEKNLMGQIENLYQEMDLNGDPDGKIQKQIEKLEEDVTEVEEEIAELNETLKNLQFSVIFRDTTAACGNDIEFLYNSADLTLTIRGAGVMTTFTNELEAPWRCVAPFIRKITIEQDVKSISNYAFHHMSNLKEVYNYGKGQTISGGNDSVFDIINRKIEYSADNTIAYVNIPDGSFDTQVASVMQAVKTYNLNITEAELRGQTLSCRKEAHTHNESSCYTDGEFTCTKQEHAHGSSCYSQTGTAAKLVPGSYVIRKSSSPQELLDILTGKKSDLTGEPYIVPVYTFGDENTAFNETVPPKEDGYELIYLYKAKGQCGDDLTFFVSLDNTLVIDGTGPMWDFAPGKSPWKEAAGYINAISFPEEMTSVGDFAFEGIQLLTGFELPEAVTRIGTGAFKDCINLYSFHIRDTFEELGEGLFAGCSSLRIVTSDNPHYYLEDGHLVSDQGVLIGFLRETLYQDAANKTLYENPTTYTIPDGITVVGAYAYYDADSFYSLFIPEAVSEIHGYAFAGMESLENIDSLAEFKIDIAGTALDGCGTKYNNNDAKKYVILYKINHDLEVIAARQGYSIVYHDAKDLSHIVATYTDGPVMLGKSFAKNNVNINLVYANGQSETIYGTDPRISFGDTTIRKLGENLFHATYDDGYGQVLQTNEFAVEGSDAVAAVEFAYTGSYVWYGEELTRDYILAKVIFASGNMKTVNGNATYATPSGNKYCISLNKTVADQAGDMEFTATYQDASSGKFSGTFKVRGLNYITGLSATYSGEPIELAAGAGGLDLDELQILVTWSDGTTETITGSDNRVEIGSEYQTVGDNLIFEYTVNEGNRYDKVGSFTCKYSTNLDSVDFEYIGSAVTSGMTFSIADVQLTLHYSNGKTEKVTGDRVTGLRADDMVIHTSDSLEEVEMTYEIGSQTFTGTIYVPGKYRVPVKLIVAKRPIKTVYQNGDIFDRSGMQVNCLFDNGQTQDVTNMLIIDGGDVLSADTKYVTLIYEDTGSGQTVRTNMAINVNQYQKTVTLQKSFKEQYEISRILFRSKKTEDLADEGDDDVNNDGEISSDEEDMGKWQDITPLFEHSSYDPDHQEYDPDGNPLYTPPVIKAGYGFELKVFTRYRTNRAGSEFNAFLKKAQWDAEFENVYSDVDHATFETRWKYLNDVYPQAAPTANPDILYFRTVNTEMVDENGDPIKNLIGGNGEATDFLVMEKTNLSETNQPIDEGEWYNSTKVFEFPLRTIVNDEQTRRVYVSKDAANPNQTYTDYEMQIISPAWYGYDPEPYFSGNEFKYSTDEGETYANKSFAYNDPETKYLHVCASFIIRVVNNDDVHTHILE